VRPMMKLALSLVTIVTLAGRPALEAACAILCEPGMTHTGHGDLTAAPEARAATEVGAHDHHRHSGSPTSITAIPTPDQFLSDGSCCEHNDTMQPPLVAAVRLDADATRAATDDDVPRLSRVGFGHLGSRDGLSPLSSATRTLFVLRI
jgi:hypothetical protein